jgi:hypothetical protein
MKTKSKHWTIFWPIPETNLPVVFKQLLLQLNLPHRKEYLCLYSGHANGLTTEELGFDARHNQDYLSSLNQLWCSYNFPFTGYRRGFFPWGYHSPQFSAKFDNMWNYTSYPSTPSANGVSLRTTVPLNSTSWWTLNGHLTSYTFKFFFIYIIILSTKFIFYHLSWTTILPVFCAVTWSVTAERHL